MKANPGREVLAKKLYKELHKIEEKVGQIEEEYDQLSEVDFGAIEFPDDSFLDFSVQHVLAAYKTLWMSMINLDCCLGLKEKESKLAVVGK